MSHRPNPRDRADRLSRRRQDDAAQPHPHRGSHGKRYAVIVNEFGEIGIDNDLIVESDEEIYEMNNGCVCCTVRGDLMRVVEGLMRRPGRFDAIVVETTGLADPAPVAQTFFMDDDVRDPRPARRRGGAGRCQALPHGSRTAARPKTRSPLPTSCC
jgi:hypothetical protein